MSLVDRLKSVPASKIKSDAEMQEVYSELQKIFGGQP